MTTFISKYGHSLLQAGLFILQAYALAAGSGKPTANNLILAAAQIAVNQHARQGGGAS